MKASFWQRIFIWEWRGWRQMIRDFVVIEFGLMLFGLALTMMIRADLGTAPWLALETALSRLLPLTLGQTIIAMAGLVILIDVLLGQRLGWGTLANMFSIGVWVDWLLPITPLSLPVLWFKLLYLLLAVAVLGLGTAVYVSVNAGAGPRDSLMLAVSRRLKVSVRAARLGIDLTVVTLAFLLGGSVGIGTLIVALTSGPAVQLAFRLLRVKPHATPEPAAAPEA